MPQPLIADRPAAVHPAAQCARQVTRTPATAAPTAITAFGCDPDEARLLRELAPRVGAHVTVVDEPLTPQTAQLARGSRCITVSHRAPITRDTLDVLARVGVRLVSTRSVGANHVDTQYAASLGITVGTVAYAPDGVADFTVMLILMTLRQARDLLSRADAFDFRLAPRRGRELRDLTVGVVGGGRIGSEVAARLAGFGCEVLVHDARDPGSVPLVTLLSRSDVVTLHTPLTARTRHLLDAERIALLPPGAVVVNTGRGGLIETEALLAALEDGRLAGAALDVVEGEEAVFYADHRSSPAAVPDLIRRLHSLPQVVITGHTAYFTDGALRDTVTGTLIACQNYESESL